MTLNDNFLPPVPLIVGFSGGVDSVWLLHWLHAMTPAAPTSRKIIAAHLNHQLRPDADADENFCREFCAARALEFFSESRDVGAAATRNKTNLEATARQMRLDFFARVGARYQTACVVLAHHADDQAETIFLRLQRGAGWRGLRGMAAQTRLTSPPLKIYRPLLAWTRAQILQNARRENLTWREDASNYDLRYARNRLRQKIFPFIQSVFPDYRQRLQRLGEIASTVTAAIDHVAANDLEKNALVIPANPAPINAELPPLTDHLQLAHLIEQYLPRLRRANVDDLAKLMRNELRVCNLPQNYHVRKTPQGFGLYQQ